MHVATEGAEPPGHKKRFGAHRQKVLGDDASASVDMMLDGKINDENDAKILKLRE